MTLFFGCRTHDDILFEEELKEYYKNGTLSSLRMAFSRENPKEYVTDFMDLQMIQDHLTLDGVIYVCGSSNMGKDVTNKIEDMYK
jgi:sulfite reductase alpha subunit-like flavoprotein